MSETQNTRLINGVIISSLEELDEKLAVRSYEYAKNCCPEGLEVNNIRIYRADRGTVFGRKQTSKRMYVSFSNGTVAEMAVGRHRGK